MDNVVIVESPAKAKTINKYLGKDFTVLASYGHVRDLPAKDGSVRPDEQFAMSWSVDDRAEKRLKEIAHAVKGAKHLYLATDPDREGEAISWHIDEILRQRNVLKGVDVEARGVPRDHQTGGAGCLPPSARGEQGTGRSLSRAPRARLSGGLYPVPGSVAQASRAAAPLAACSRWRCVSSANAKTRSRLFKAREYWTIEVEFETPKGERFTARLTHLDGKKLDKFDLDSEEKAKTAVAPILAEPGFTVASVEKKQVRRHPPAPFTTSTLQQEASRKLGFGASRTMRVAQRLYEDGYITYMRTDGVTLANEAVAGARRLIAADFGDRYLPEKPRQYTARAKNAQEAHEAIRPTDLFQRPAQVRARSTATAAALYELDLEAHDREPDGGRGDRPSLGRHRPADKTLRFRATGSTILFDGFLKLYREDVDDPGEEEEGGRLPALTERDALNRDKVTPSQHFTEPPPRYSEASLVKKLEELGIGRPSTYASIIQVLQDRDYVKLDKKRFIPEDRGRVVTAFLENFFERYVEYGFTADLENQLDEISDGRISWRKVLEDFWRHFSGAVAGTKDLTITQVLDALDVELGNHFFPPRADGTDPRLCPVCNKGRLGLKLGKFGGFIGCSNYPECRYTRKLGFEGDDENGDSGDAGPRLLGNDPVSGLPVTLRKGPYGNYVQLGEAVEKGEKPKRQSLPRGLAPADVDLDKALGLLSLPREIGKHPEDGLPILASLGRYGPYIKHGDNFRSLAPDDDVLSVGINRAVSLLAEPRQARGRAQRESLKSFDHADGKIMVYKGKYGNYVARDGVNATLPSDVTVEELTADQAANLLAERAAKSGGKRHGRGGARRAPAKSDAKPKAAKKPAAKSAKKKAAAE